MNTLIISGAISILILPLILWKSKTGLHHSGRQRTSVCVGTQDQSGLYCGDFDSVPAEVIREYRAHNRIPHREYNPVKDATDTQIALEKAISHGSSQIWLLGATGRDWTIRLGISIP